MSRPGRVVGVRDGEAQVEVGGRRAWFNALLTPDVRPGAWVLTHTSLVLSEITAHEAESLDALFREAMEVTE